MFDDSRHKQPDGINLSKHRMRAHVDGDSRLRLISVEWTEQQRRDYPVNYSISSWGLHRYGNKRRWLHGLSLWHSVLHIYAKLS